MATITKFKILVGVLLISIAIPLWIKAAKIGEKQEFYIDPSFDISRRSELTAGLFKITKKLYFYIDKSWWDSQTLSRQNEILGNLDSLAQEFEKKIYPDLTSAFGFEWKPGVDGDEGITILIHPMKEEVGGYFRITDEYLKLQFPESNEREMVYLNANQIDNPRAKTLLAHEFLHLITFNQKEKLRGVSEETWLNEARAEYAPTFLGYDYFYEGSNLQKRVNIFLEKPSDSITEWQNKKADYGSINLFIQYLVDHYGIGILIDSLHSKKIGIESLNEALSKNGFKEDFSQIFTDWTIAVLVNDCSLGPKYCYLSENLEKIQITPIINFLPLWGKINLSVTDVTKNWSGNWYKFIGGKGILKFEFSSLTGLNFKVPYLIQDKEGKYLLNFLILDENQKGEVSIPDFNTENLSFIIILSLQTKFSGFDGVDPTYPFSVTISVVEKTSEEEAELVKKLLEQIEFLQKEITEVQAKINAILASRGQKIICGRFEKDLIFGIMNDPEVQCLQEFLKSQGAEIYPEGLVTGNFLSLTQVAVIRFQEKYKEEILIPLSLEMGTGYVGGRTRAKINEILGK